MNNRTKWLYIVVPLLWILFLTAAIGMARVRTPGQPLTRQHMQQAPAQPQQPAPDADEDEQTPRPAGARSSYRWEGTLMASGAGQGTRVLRLAPTVGPA